MNIRIEDIPVSDRPFEKYKRAGLKALSDSELLALVLRKGTRNTNCLTLCQEILKLGDGGVAGLCGLEETALCGLPGIGPVKATQILVICELARRIAKTKRAYDEPLDSAERVAAKYMEDMRHLKEEHVLLLLLDTKFRLIKEVTIGIGSVNQSILRPREIFVQAFKHAAVHIILLHNHPSGDPTPSKSDILVTRKIIGASQMVGIPLEDHIIIGDCCHISMREENIVDFDIKSL